MEHSDMASPISFRPANFGAHSPACCAPVARRQCAPALIPRRRLPTPFSLSLVGLFGSLALQCLTSAAAWSQDASPAQSIVDEVRAGLLAHHVEPAGTERGLDVNAEILFRRPAITFDNAFADFTLRPRLHLGTSINIEGNTDQVYAGLTWDIPLPRDLLLEFSFGGSRQDGPDDEVAHASFGCRLNFRESASVGYKMTEHWRLYGTVAHMSNAGLCDRNSGLTSAGIRFGYVTN